MSVNGRFRDRIQVETREGVAVVTLARPAKLNAIDEPMWTALDELTATLVAADDLRVAILTGAGRAFCAGLDLTDADTSQAALEAAYQRMQRTLARVEALPVPLLAAINGPCIAAGLELVLVADIRLAAESAFFALPEVPHGVRLVPGGLAPLERLVGPGCARELAYTGRRLPAAEAYHWRLVEHVVPDADLLVRARELAASMAAHPPVAVRAAKQSFRASAASEG